MLGIEGAQRKGWAPRIAWAPLLETGQRLGVITPSILILSYRSVTAGTTPVAHTVWVTLVVCRRVMKVILLSLLDVLAAAREESNGL